jgi:uncharacterized protein
LSILLPLFPLDLVLFPGSPLPLHIFELRYREMISECLDHNKPFGVVRAKADGIAETGCTAEIISVVKKYDDGRMDILTQGRARFEIAQVNQARAFLQAEVIYLPDETGKATSGEETLAITLHAEAMGLAGVRPALDLDFKQSLLETRSEAERVRAVISFLEAVLSNLRRTVHVRNKAGGNGHAS